jgi:predicted GIY-YIG superfamily endonuclease
MHWVYILECDNDSYYIGETKRLYRRFWEHQQGRGGLNTYNNTPRQIVAIYKITKMYNFLQFIKLVINKEYDIYFNEARNLLKKIEEDDSEQEYDNLYVENNITEWMMLHNEEKWENVRGGKYTHYNCCYTFPKNELIKHLPACKCGLPCDVNYNKDGYLYFRCPLKNMWPQMKADFKIYDEPCSFFMKYQTGINYMADCDTKRDIVYTLIKQSPWLKYLLNIYSEKCVGGCNIGYSQYNKIRYLNKNINLCFDCFINKNTELKSKYDITASNKCLIVD